MHSWCNDNMFGKIYVKAAVFLFFFLTPLKIRQIFVNDIKFVHYSVNSLVSWSTFVFHKISCWRNLLIPSVGIGTRDLHFQLSAGTFKNFYRITFAGSLLALCGKRTCGGI